jgi:hypothetical protein
VLTELPPALLGDDLLEGRDEVLEILRGQDASVAAPTAAFFATKASANDSASIPKHGLAEHLDQAP